VSAFSPHHCWTLTVPANSFVPGLATARFATVVTATLPSSIIVERAMYWNAAGGFWDAGTNAVAVPIP
jgi:hypothetical protein